MKWSQGYVKPAEGSESLSRVVSLHDHRCHRPDGVGQQSAVGRTLLPVRLLPTQFRRLRHALAGVPATDRWDRIRIFFSGTKGGSLGQLAATNGPSSVDDLNCHFLICNGNGSRRRRDPGHREVAEAVVDSARPDLAGLRSDYPHLLSRRRGLRPGHQLPTQASRDAPGSPVPQVPRPRRERLPAAGLSVVLETPHPHTDPARIPIRHYNRYRPYTFPPDPAFRRAPTVKQFARATRGLGRAQLNRYGFDMAGEGMIACRMPLRGPVAAVKCDERSRTRPLIKEQRMGVWLQIVPGVSFRVGVHSDRRRSREHYCTFGEATSFCGAGFSWPGFIQSAR